VMISAIRAGRPGDGSVAAIEKCGAVACAPYSARHHQS
jgi:hypothetical protein